ncbi:hypothetical protein, partial [Cellulomonas sp. RIT-PI-Y]|uniref:hypothetical protein n=1 Tax=Cellulomonas sp. RIT-PI-Y TaxID=3035297 RepID=UPI0021D96B4E
GARDITTSVELIEFTFATYERGPPESNRTDRTHEVPDEHEAIVAPLERSTILTTLDVFCSG